MNNILNNILQKEMENIAHVHTMINIGYNQQYFFWGEKSDVLLIWNVSANFEEGNPLLFISHFQTSDVLDFSCILMGKRNI